MPRRAPAVVLPARYYARLAELLARLGADVPRILKAAGVDSRGLAGPDTTLRLDQVEKLVAEALRLTGRSDLAYELGHGLKLSSHAMLGYGMLSSPDFDYALRLTARYFGLITPTF